MKEIISYQLNEEELKNDELWKQEKEDLDKMAETMESIVEHYKNQGVKFWHKIDKYAPMNECVCYLSETEETFHEEMEEGMICMPGNAKSLIIKIETMFGEE